MKLKERTADLDAAVGSIIKETRLRQKISQETLAAKIGVTFQQVQKYEKGTNRVAFGTLALIASALDTDAVQLFARSIRRYEGLPDRDTEQPLPTEVRVNGPRVEIERKNERPTSFILSESCANIVTGSGEEITVVRSATNPFYFEIRGEVFTAALDIKGVIQEATLHVVRENA